MGQLNMASKRNIQKLTVEIFTFIQHLAALNRYIRKVDPRKNMFCLKEVPKSKKKHFWEKDRITQ